MLHDGPSEIILLSPMFRRGGGRGAQRGSTLPKLTQLKMAGVGLELRFSGPRLEAHNPYTNLIPFTFYTAIFSYIVWRQYTEEPGQRQPPGTASDALKKASLVHL